MSTTARRSTRPRFTIGSKLWPPAITRASPSYARTISDASASVPARSSPNGLTNIRVARLHLRLPCLLETQHLDGVDRRHLLEVLVRDARVQQRREQHAQALGMRRTR